MKCVSLAWGTFYLVNVFCFVALDAKGKLTRLYERVP